MPQQYQIASVFLIRAAGVPFEVLERLSTTGLTLSARNFVGAEAIFKETQLAVKKILTSRQHNLSKGQYRGWRVISQLQNSSAEISRVPVSSSGCFKSLWEEVSRYFFAASDLEEILGKESKAARTKLLENGSQYLPGYLVFAANDARLLLKLNAQHASRNKTQRARERHLLLYLQRISAKNDTLSEFGPASWGRIDPKSILQIKPEPGIKRREVFLERWTAHGVAAAVNADREALAEIAPRLNPDGRLENLEFVHADNGERTPLDLETSTLLKLIDGKRPAFSLAVEFEKLEALVSQKILRWQLEVPALEAHAFDQLLDDISAWRDNDVRKRWLKQLQPIRQLAETFAQTREPTARVVLVKEVEERLEELGAHKTANRFLYSATNPIAEECVRQSNFVINESLIHEVTTDAAPWIDLWRDNYAFVASRVAAGLRQVFEQAPIRNGALPLPEFLRCCRDANLPLEGAGMVALAHLAFREVRAAFAEKLRDRTHLQLLQLTAEDCHVVRREFSYPKFDECTYPSADLQLAASSVDAVQQGDYQWVLAELHPPIALLHHGFYWSCPDKAALSAAIEQTLFGKPYLYYGYFAADFTATTSVHLDAFPKSTKFVAPERSVGEFESVRPADAEVFVDQSGDVGVRVQGTHKYLGSFARGWVIPLGFHPFYFSLGEHSPRLYCGKVVVQRESWTVTREELGSGDFTGLSRDLVIAIEKLRAARNLPRHVFIRPTEQALRRSGVEGRDKDTKPVYIDFESYLFLEIFHRWITKAGELEITEMLPRPDQLLWCEADGHHTFELRTQIIPG